MSWGNASMHPSFGGMTQSNEQIFQEAAAVRRGPGPVLQDDGLTSRNEASMLRKLGVVSGAAETMSPNDGAWSRDHASMFRGSGRFLA